MPSTVRPTSLTTFAITDPADPRLDDYRALNDQPFRRRYEGDQCCIVEGYVAIDRLLESGHRVRSVLLASSRVDRFAERAAMLTERGVPVFVASRQVIGSVVGFDLHRGVVACAERRPLPDLAQLTATSTRLAVLEGLNDAENLGAIARAARAFGVGGMLIDPTCTDPYSRRTIRVSMGEVLGLPIGRATAWSDALADVRQAGFEVWAMTPSAADDIWSLEVPPRLAVMFGSEGPGLTSTALGLADRHVRIPIAAEVDSLNVAHAAAIAFAAVSRPR